MALLFTPLPEREFTPYHAAHLLWRAGFGGTWEEIETLAKRGLAGAVEWLVNFPRSEIEAPPFIKPKEDERTFEQRMRGLSEEERRKLRNERNQLERDGITSLRFWWLNRMLTTAHPLEEK